MKLRGITWLAGLIVSIALVGQGQQTATNKVVSLKSPEEIQSLRMMRTGGLAAKREAGASILLIDARAVGSPCDLDILVNDLESAFGVSFKVNKKPAEKGEKPMKLALAALQEKEIGVVIVVLEEGMDAPSLSVFPEDRMAFINATRICIGANREVSEKRISSEIWRAISFAAGGVNSYTPYCVLSSPVLQPKDLDRLGARVASPEVCEQVLKSAEKLGLSTVKVTTYRTACVQGWASMPTNAIQKAIWEDVKVKKTPGKEKK